MADNCFLCAFNTKKRIELTEKNQKLTEDAYKWHSIFKDYLGRECDHITIIFEEEWKLDLWFFMAS